MRFDKPEQERWSQIDGFIPPWLTEMDDDREERPSETLERLSSNPPRRQPFERPESARVGADPSSTVAPCALRPGGLSGSSRTHSPLGGDS